jgi:hypothetical protein
LLKNAVAIAVMSPVFTQVMKVASASMMGFGDAG